MTSTTGGTYNFKVVLLGEGCVGKTSLLLRYIEDKFNDKHLTTLQVLYHQSVLSLGKHVYIRFKILILLITRSLGDTDRIFLSNDFFAIIKTKT